jgi:alkanesulfonate monooxygenase SsuD/methylene tetrahydromethanopterin reductase-like flavin-dependent oxidoreductase (luciferase family)
MPVIPARSLAVGLMLWPIEDRARGTTPRWRDLLAQARRAEELGFAALWIPDHLTIHLPFPGEQPSGAWDAWSIAAALAAATERIGLGFLVACTAFRNPALVAKMADTVDEISGGRLTLGLGAGWDEAEFRAFGYPFDHRVSRFEEAVTIVRQLLREGRLDYAGRYYQMLDCELRPRGPRPQGPPVLIGSSANGERMLRLTARHADVWNRDFDVPCPGETLYSPADLDSAQRRLDAACAAEGRDPATLTRTAGVWVDLPDGPSRAAWGALRGSSAELAAALRRFADAGFHQVQVWLNVPTVAGIEAFAPVLEALHSSAA